MEEDALGIVGLLDESLVKRREAAREAACEESEAAK